MSILVPRHAGSGLSRRLSNSSAMPTGDAGVHWKYSYGQDFLVSAPLGQFGSVYGANWNGYSGINNDTSKVGSYQPDKVLSVPNGSSCLDIWVHYDNASGLYCVASPFPQPPAGVNGGSQEYLYMRTSVRFKSDIPMPLYKTAWMLWPSSYSWEDGEIDFVEGALDGTICGFSHAANVGSPQTNTLAVDSHKPYNDAWHIATVEWSPGLVRMFVDGIFLGQTTTAVPTKPMHINLQTETNLSGTVPDQATQGHISVDWIAVWQYV